MATINLFIRTENKKKLANIYIRLRDGRAVDLTAKSGLYIQQEFWSEPNGNVKQKAEFSAKDEMELKLKEIKRFIEDEFVKVPDKKNPGTDWLKKTIEKYHNPENSEHNKLSFLKFIEKFIKLSMERINPSSGKKLSNGTVEKYGNFKNHIVKYANSRNLELNFESIDLNFYHDFVNYLTYECNLSTNSVGKQISILKLFMNIATEHGINSNTVFRNRSFKTMSEDSESIYLNEFELDMMWKHDFSTNKRLEKVRDLFLVGCWTGCRFSDLESINLKNIKENLIFLEQEKTGNKVVIPFHPVVKSILEKYEWCLPKLPSNQKFNDYLKEVSSIIGFNTIETKSITRGGKRITETFPKWQLVSSHTARRSFATNLYKSGFPSISIMSITGHHTEKAFLKYIKVTPEEHAILLQNHWNLISSI